MLKKVIGLVMSMAMIIGCMPATLAQAAQVDDNAAQTQDSAELQSGSEFDPETVMWTNNPIENVLAQEGIYKTVKDVNPNADKKDTDVQNPYASNGDNYNGWEYSEFVWTNYYPVGNGRMAGMVAGGIDNEVIQINEDTCWDGSPYGTLKDEGGNTLTTIAQTNAAQKITTEDPTSGSVEGAWRYYRGANADGTPAEIGSAGVLVGDEAFRTEYPEFADQSISNQALNIDNSKTQEAVQDRWSMEGMVEETFLGSPSRQRAYKSFVEVYLDFGQNHEQASNYTKSLDMETGVVTVEYDYDGSHFKRETFASYPDQVVVTHVESDSALNFSAQLHTYHSEKDGYYSYEKVSDNEVKVTAAITNGSRDNNEVGTVNAIKFEARMFLDGDGTFSVSDDNTTVTVNGGNEANIYVVGATNYVDYLTLDNTKPSADCDRYATNVKSRTYEQIKERHLADFSEQFNRTELNIDNANGVDYSDTPTEQRVRKNIYGESGFLTGAGSRTSDANKNGVYTTYSEGDNQLATLEFNYGKYLILSGSRDGRDASEGEIAIQESQPLNLTGKWNAAFSASWNGKYTININTEMNYWAAQPLNIGDSEKPLIDTFDELAQSGSITAANQYAIYNDRGDDTYQPGDPWVMHHNYDLWRGTQPIDNATAGLWPTGGIWLLDHAWQYYQYNKDTEYLAEVYPYMVGAAKFFTQFLVVDPKTGYLITAASCSPEQGGVQPGPAMDTQLVRNLYDMVRQASEILGKTSENADLLAKIDEQMPSSYLADEKGKLAPNLIDDSGLIQEWVRGDVTFDIGERDSGQWEVTNPFTNETVRVYDHGASNNNGHRHCSHLWEMFPGTHLSAYSEDENEQDIFQAFQKSVASRGTGSGQGWGLAWRINLNARALDGNAASTMLEQLFTTRTSPNLFDQHPNFQIDGNYGATSGIIEMLVQSHDGTINLLPALPDQWQSGSFKGFNTREGATVDLTWSNGRPTEAKLHVRESGDMNIRTIYAPKAKVYDETGAEVTATVNEDGNLLTFNVEAGKTYTINNFGTDIMRTVYAAADTTEFYASDGGAEPKIANGNEVGYLYNDRGAGVKLGYAVDDFSFDGLQSLELKMAEVRSSAAKVSITLDSPTGTEIANQSITAGPNQIELKNIDGVTGEHKIYLLYYTDPYDSDQKYIGNASDLTATYRVEDAPEPTVQPVEFDYNIREAYFNRDGLLSVDIGYSGEDPAPSAKLIAATYDENGILADMANFDISGAITDTFDYAQPENGTTKVYIWDSMESMIPLSEVKEAEVMPAPTPPATPNPTLDPSTYVSVNDVTTADRLGEINGRSASDYYVCDNDFEWKSDVKESYKTVFGEDFSDTYASRYIDMRNNASIDVPFTVGADEAANYTLYTLCQEYNGRYYTGRLYAADGATPIGDEINNVALSGISVVASAHPEDNCSASRRQVAIVEFELGDLEAGNYVFRITGVSNSNPLLAVAFYTDDIARPTAAPQPTATPTATPGPTQDPTTLGAYVNNVKYNTVREAVAAAAKINPQREEDRVYIDIMPGAYREQVVVNTPYVTMRRAPETEGAVTLTWYYGLGSLYDSCNEDGYYDPSVIGDGESYGPSDWGPALKVDRNATGFTAENLIIENSYNKYYTEEELADITDYDPDPNNSDFRRKEWIQAQKSDGVSDDEINSYLQSRRDITFDGVTGSPRERCAALHCSADKASFINCEIMSTQDTIGINTGRMYFKDCKLGGTTDYICGSATAVFDNCELYTNAGPLQAESATITAPSNAVESEGYLFWNCRVTGSDTATPGSMGRPWGSGGGPAAAYINTTVSAAGVSSGNDKYLISGTGWSDMSANKPEDARFYEYGTVNTRGEALDTSKRRGSELSDNISKGLLDEWQVLRFNPYTYTAGSDGWDPAGVAESYAGVNEIISTATVTIPEGDSNTVDLPTAPEGYEYKWESNSEYAIVSEDGTQIAVIRPASGEQPIESSITLYVRDANNKGVGAQSTIPVSISATTDTTNVFTTSGTISVSGNAPESDVTVSVKFYKGAALIKQAAATIEAGQTQAEYTAEGIPVGDYDVVFDSQNSEYKILTPTDGATTVSGGVGQTQNIDATIARLVNMSYDITSDPTTFGSGASVANNGDGSFTITGNGNGGAYWNISDMIANIAESDTVTVCYTFDMSASYQSSNNGAAVDITNGRPGEFNTNANDDRYARTNAGRWTQLNMFDIGAGATSGSSNTEHQWLNCANSNFNNNPVQNVRVTIDYKNGRIIGEAKTDSATEWNSYDAFTGFPAGADKEDIYVAVYPGNAGSNTFTVKDISIEYAVFE